MSEANTRRFPEKESIIEDIADKGSVAAVARGLGLSPSTLKDYIAREGFKEEADEARELHMLEKTAPEPEETEEGVSEIEVLRQRVKEQEKAIRETKNEDIAEERLSLRLEAAIPKARQTYVVPSISNRERLDPHEFVVLFSDTHAAEVVDSEATLGMNEYNWEIMIQRMQKFQKSIISYQQNRPYPIKTLNLAMLGDMLSGDIHDELMITNDRTLDEAVVDLAFDISAWAEAFGEYFEKINVIGVPGNHPRRAQKPQAKLQQNNADWILYRFIQSRLENHKNANGDPLFSWNFPRSHYAVQQVAQSDDNPNGWRFLFTHGDGIRSTMPGVPWGGVSKMVTVLEQQFTRAKLPLDYVAMGHFHTLNAIDGVGTKTFMNGSVKGLDEYSLNKFGSGRPPTQTILTVHPLNGVTDLSFVDLEPTMPNGAL